MNTILVTGGAGYVGSHTCKELNEHGYLSVTYDNLSTGLAKLVHWGPLEVGDLLDLPRLRQVMQHYKPKGVIHFAARSDVNESLRQPGLYFQTNIMGTLNLLEAMRYSKIQKIIVSSTCAVYGQPTNDVPLALDEATPIMPISPYGQSKWAMEQLIHSYSQAYGIEYTTLRYFNAAGADPGLQTGECHYPETHLIPLALQALKPDALPLKVFGTDYPTPDGTCIRDYVHVSDLAKAHVLALQQPQTNTCYNLGSEFGYSVKEILDNIKTVTALEVPHIQAPRRAGDPPCLLANIQKAKAHFGWEPKLGLAEIIRTAWQWEKTKGLY